MTPESQFWWNWGVQAAVAVGTAGAALAALFGEWVRDKLRKPPVLRVALRSELGERTVLKAPDYTRSAAGALFDFPARYYHLRVTNERRASPADDVQVFLLRVEEFGSDLAWHVVWNGEAPMRWRNWEISPLTRRIGPAADCDLCHIVKGRGLYFEPVLTPNNLRTQHDQANLILTLQAKSVQADSPAIRVAIQWDSLWEDDAAGMAKHSIVRVLQSGAGDEARPIEAA